MIFGIVHEPISRSCDAPRMLCGCQCCDGWVGMDGLLSLGCCYFGVVVPQVGPMGWYDYVVVS